jgi:hypothetical protein
MAADYGSHVLLSGIADLVNSSTVSSGITIEIAESGAQATNTPRKRDCMARTPSIGERR